MATKQSSFDRWMAEVRQDLARQQGSLMPEQRQVIERQIGRPLTDREVFSGGINRKDNRTLADVIQDGNWRPVMPASADTDLDRMIADAEKAVMNEQYEKLSPAERRVFQLKQMKLEQQRKEATQAEFQARMNDPRVSKSLEKLNALKAKIAYDPSWSVADVNAIERAILQLTTPGADISHGIELTREAFGIAATKTEAVKQKILERQQTLQSELAALDEDYSLEFGDNQQATNAEPARSAEWLQREEELLNATFEAGQVWKGLEVGTEERLNAALAVKSARAALEAHRESGGDEGGSDAE